MVKTGITFGSALAMAISFNMNQSVFGALILSLFACVFFTLFLGCGLLVYIIAWNIVPKDTMKAMYPGSAKTA
jgi:phage shock protein PspC (stress-responsive transcriptional regulator)